MVGESAAVIMARSVHARGRRPWPLYASIGAAALIAFVVATFVITRRPAVTSLASGTRQITSSTSNSPTEDEAARGALAAYRGYQIALAGAGQQADSQDLRLKAYLGDPALIQTRIMLRSMAQSGLEYRGAFKGTLIVTHVSLATQTVELTNCQDISSLEVVDALTRKPTAATSQNLRFPVYAEARFYQGRWMIVRATADRSQKC